MSRLFDVVILGSGPAGCAAAAALAGKGFTTAVVSKGVTTGVQGLSARALVSLTEAGLAPAARCASGPAARVVFWSGERSERGQEGLVEREMFDARLRSCLPDVFWMDAVARSITFADDVWQVDTSLGPIRGRTLLDARGRRTRRSDERGPLLVSWSLNLRLQHDMNARSAIAALDDGWCWLAITPGDAWRAIRDLGKPTGGSGSSWPRGFGRRRKKCPTSSCRSIGSWPEAVTAPAPRWHVTHSPRAVPVICGLAMRPWRWIPCQAMVCTRQSGRHGLPWWR